MLIDDEDHVRFVLIHIQAIQDDWNELLSNLIDNQFYVIGIELICD